MKQFLAWLGTVMLLLSPARAETDLYFSLPEFNAAPSTNRQVVLLPQTPFVGNAIWLNLSDSNGLTWYSNATVGLFNGYIAAPPGRIPFQIYVTSTNLGTVDAASITASGSAATDPAGAVAWSIFASDARYGPSSNLVTGFVTWAAQASLSNNLAGQIGTSLTAATNLDWILFTNATLSGTYPFLLSSATGYPLGSITGVGNLAQWAGLGTNTVFLAITNIQTNVINTSNGLAALTVGATNTPSLVRSNLVLVTTNVVTQITASGTGGSVTLTTNAGGITAAFTLTGGGTGNGAPVAIYAGNGITVSSNQVGGMTNYTITATGLTNALPTNTASVIIGQTLFYGTNYDANGAALAATGALSGLAWTNPAAVAYQNGNVSNLVSQGSISLGSTNWAFMQLSTNIIGCQGAGSVGANGTYQYMVSGGYYTNVSTAQTFAIVPIGPAWIIQSNNISLYAASSLVGPWSLAGTGAYPAPTTYIGAYFQSSGLVMLGFLNGTNLNYLITNLQPTNMAAGSTPATVTNTGPLVGTALTQLSVASNAAVVAAATIATNFTVAQGAANTNFTLITATALTNLVGASSNAAVVAAGTIATNTAVTYGTYGTNFTVATATSLTNLTGAASNAAVIAAATLGTNSAVAASNGVMAIFNANVAKFANIGTNLWIGTNSFAQLNFSNLVVQGAGTTAANSSQYVWDGARWTNAVNGDYFTNNTGSGKTLLNTAAGSTLYSWTIGVVHDMAGTVVNGSAPGPLAAYGLLMDFSLNGVTLANANALTAGTATNGTTILVDATMTSTMTTNGNGTKNYALSSSGGNSNALTQAQSNRLAMALTNLDAGTLTNSSAWPAFTNTINSQLALYGGGNLPGWSMLGTNVLGNYLLGATYNAAWGALSTNILSGLGGGSGTYNYNSLSNTPTLGNAAGASTNTMKVYAATNADSAATAGTATNGPLGTPLLEQSSTWLTADFVNYILTNVTAATATTAGTATNAYQLVTPTLLDRFNAQPAIGLEQIYALDNFNRASNSLFGAGIVINSPIGNQVTFANGGWAGYYSITNGYLEISNTAAGGTPMFLAQKPIRVGDFVSAKVLSIDHGAVGVGLADVGFYNTNKPGGYANIAVARFGDEQSTTHYSLGMRWTDFTNTTYIYSSQDVLSDFGDASTILALGVSYDTTNTCTFWVQGSWVASQFNCPLGSESKWYPYASLTNSQLPGCLPGLSSSGGQVNCVEQFDDFTVRHNWRPDPQNQLLLFHGGTTYVGLQYFGDHVPDVLKLPNGGFVYTGESGTNHSSSDLVLWAQYCSPQGRWYPATNLLASSIVGNLTNTYNAAACALVNGQIWFIYDQSTNSFKTGGGVYYNILTVTNGIFTLGVQNPFPFCGTNDGVHQYLNNNGIFQVPAGYPFAGRYLFEWGSYNGSGMATASQVAWSDDGTNWNTTASISGFGNPGETSIVSQRDGTLIALQNQGQTAGTNLLTSVSVNGGTNWTAWLPATNLANANLNLVSAYNRPMTHLLPNGLYAIATVQGPNDRTNGIIYICDTGAKVVRTIPFGWYGPTASLAGLVQYPDFAVDGDYLDLVWSGGVNGIHFYKVPLKYADTIWSSSGTSYANYCSGLTNLNINSTSQTNVTLINPTFTGTSTGATMQVTTVNATIVNGNGYGLTNVNALSSQRLDSTNSTDQHLFWNVNNHPFVGAWNFLQNNGGVYNLVYFDLISCDGAGTYQTNSLKADTFFHSWTFGDGTDVIYAAPNGNGYGLTNLQASGVSTNGGTAGQVMINGGNGTVLWTNNQSIVAAGTGETTETMSTNPVTGQVTYTSNVNTNQFLASTGNLPFNGGAITNLNVSSLVINTNAAPLTNTIVGFFWITNGSSVFKVPVLQ
jgi:hypothetical protein